MWKLCVYCVDDVSLTSEGVFVESLVMEVVEEQNWRSGLGGESVKSFMCLGEGWASSPHSL